MVSLWHKQLLLVIGLAGISAAGWAADASQARQLRFLSQTLRDQPPSVEEAQALARQEKTFVDLRDQWLNGAPHLQRVARYFSDMLGAANDFFVTDDAYFLEQNADGIYFSRAKGDCVRADAVDAHAWWLTTSNATIKMCPNIISNSLSITENGNYYGCSWTDGFLRQGCGCGPFQILCYPKALQQSLSSDLAHEFKDRAVYSYRSDLSWQDLLSGSMFYANRPMYQFYLLQQFVVPFQAAAPTNEIARLFSIPMGQKIWTSMPASGGERAGIVTSPAFLRRFNNFRSRVRAITNALFCRDVDSSLNTSGIQTLVNPDHSALDFSLAERTPCQSCHLAMDNMGATLFNWNDEGTYTVWPQQKSQAGHVFGNTGSGPEFLMTTLIDNGPGFYQCMTQTAWENFSGKRWDTLSMDDQNRFLDAAHNGPRPLLQAIFRSDALLGARSPDDATEPSALSFQRDINPILKTKCSGAACHNRDSALGANYQFIDNPERFRAAPWTRMDDGSMPPAATGIELDDEQRQLLIQFVRK